MEKVEIKILKEYYVGKNKNKEVQCILDDDCVRYMVYEKNGVNEKMTKCKKYRNEHKDICLKDAEKELYSIN